MNAWFFFGKRRVNRRCKELCFTDGMLKGSLAEGRKKK